MRCGWILGAKEGLKAMRIGVAERRMTLHAKLAIGVVSLPSVGCGSLCAWYFVSVRWSAPDPILTGS